VLNWRQRRWFGTGHSRIWYLTGWDTNLRFGNAAKQGLWLLSASTTCSSSPLPLSGTYRLVLLLVALGS
jgi:hypothetical protein